MLARYRRKSKPQRHYFGEVRDNAKSVLKHTNDWLPKNMPSKNIANRTSSAFVNNFLPRQQIVSIANKMYEHKNDKTTSSDYIQATPIIEKTPTIVISRPQTTKSLSRSQIFAQKPSQGNISVSSSQAGPPNHVQIAIIKELQSHPKK